MPYFFIIHYSYFYWSFAVTVTIKKNVDVQASLEAKTLKYQIKRDLSGDVVWTNTTNVGVLATTIFAPNWWAGDTATGQTEGFNFFKMPKLKVLGGVSAFGMTFAMASIFGGKGQFFLNGVKKMSTKSMSISSMSSSAGQPVSCFVSTVQTVTPAPVSLSTAGASPNVVSVKAFVSMISYMGSFGGGLFRAYMTGQAQRNDKVTVMK